MWGGIIFESNICRLCTGSDEMCVPIFEKDEGDDSRHILHKLKRCLPISVNEEDIKPKQICYSCLSKLEICFSFVESSMAADYKFDTIIQNTYSAGVSPNEKELTIQGDGKTSSLDDPIIELRSEDGMWGMIKECSEGDRTSSQKPPPSTQTEASSSSATVTVEHVAVHTEQLSSDRVIVLSKVEARGDDRNGSVVVGNQEGNCPDILLMVELKYKDVVGETSTGKVPTITYATSEHPAVITQFKPDTNTTNTQLVVPTAPPTPEKPAAPEKKFHCTICNKYFMRRTNLNAHIALHSDVRPFSCDICGKSFVTRWDVTLHKRLHSGQFSCDFCDKVFAVKCKLERHRRVHTGEKPFACPNCPKAFSDKRNLQAHLRCHTGEKPYSCNVCGKSFRSKSHLTDHNRVHTIEKPYICHVCGKSFKWKTTLNVHLKYHAGELYSCDICSKKFTRRADLKKHIMSHSVERPFPCEICKKHFKDCNTLRKHAKSHSQTKPYECLQCGKTFLFQWYLTTHMKVHEKQPLKCNICAKIFIKKGMFIAHKKTHINDKRFNCAICNEQFRSEETMVQHMAQMHPNVVLMQ